MALARGRRLGSVHAGAAPGWRRLWRARARRTLVPGDGTRPWIGIAADIDDARVPVARKFWIHHKMPKAAIDWLDMALQGGTVAGARGLVAGDLDDWPFVDDNGRFEATASIRDGRIRFRKDWPELEAMQAGVAFVGNGFSVLGQGRVAGLGVQRVQAGIADFSHAPLLVRAEAKGDAARMLDLLRRSPLARENRETLTNLDAGGPAATTFAPPAAGQRGPGGDRWPGHARWRAPYREALEPGVRGHARRGALRRQRLRGAGTGGALWRPGWRARAALGAPRGRRRQRVRSRPGCADGRLRAAGARTGTGLAAAVHTRPFAVVAGDVAVQAACGRQRGHAAPAFVAGRDHAEPARAAGQAGGRDLARHRAAWNAAGQRTGGRGVRRARGDPRAPARRQHRRAGDLGSATVAAEPPASGMVVGGHTRSFDALEWIGMAKGAAMACPCARSTCWPTSCACSAARSRRRG